MKNSTIFIYGFGILILVLLMGSLLNHFDTNQTKHLLEIKYQLENQQKSLNILNENMQILQDQSNVMLNYYKKFTIVFNILQNENPYNTIDELSEITNAIIIWSQCKNINPKLLISLILIESMANHNAISSVGATGVMQLMPFHLDKYIKEPTIDEHIMEGLTYLKYLINNYGEVGGLKRYLCGESNKKCINSKEANKYYLKIKNKQIKI